MSSEELDAVRKEQQENKQIPGIYGSYSKWREASFEEQKQMLEAGKPFVVRFRSPGDTQKRVVVRDLVKGDVETQDNFIDIVLLKSKD